MVAVVVALACAVDSAGDPGASTSVEDTTAATTHVSASGDAQHATCDCRRPDGQGPLSYDWVHCGWGPCGTIEFDCGGAGWNEERCVAGGAPRLDVTAVDCALDLLERGEPGLVHYTASPIPSEFREAFVKIGADRAGLTQSLRIIDLIGSTSDLEIITLRDAEYFRGCQRLPDPFDRFTCLTDWSDDEVQAVCPPLP